MGKRFSSEYASSFVQRDSTLEVVTSAHMCKYKGWWWWWGGVRAAGVDTRCKKESSTCSSSKTQGGGGREEEDEAHVQGRVRVS